MSFTDVKLGTDWDFNNLRSSSLGLAPKRKAFEFSP